jgi:hypothetical protein
MSTLVDKAAEQAQQVAHGAAEVLPAALPIETVRLTAKKARKQAKKAAKKAAKQAAKTAAKQVAKQQQRRRRRQRSPRRSGGGLPTRAIFVIAGVGAIVGVVMIVRRRAATQRDADLAGTPDAFGAAVAAERSAMGNGAPRPIATPGA